MYTCMCLHTYVDICTYKYFYVYQCMYIFKMINSYQYRQFWFNTSGFCLVFCLSIFVNTFNREKFGCQFQFISSFLQCIQSPPMPTIFSIYNLLNPHRPSVLCLHNGSSHTVLFLFTSPHCTGTAVPVLGRGGNKKGIVVILKCIHIFQYYL